MRANIHYSTASAVLFMFLLDFGAHVDTPKVRLLAKSSRSPPFSVVARRNLHRTHFFHCLRKGFTTTTLIVSDDLLLGRQLTMASERES